MTTATTNREQARQDKARTFDDASDAYKNGADAVTVWEILSRAFTGESRLGAYQALIREVK